MSFTVRWGREKLHFPLPPPETKLGVIRNELAQYTGLEPGAFKLIHAGAVMKDDSSSLSAYHIHDKSTLVIIGGSEKLLPPPPQTHSTKVPSNIRKPDGPRTQESTIALIRTEVQTMRSTLVPMLDKFLAALSPPNAALSAHLPPPGTAEAPASLPTGQSPPTPHLETPSRTNGTITPSRESAREELELEHVRLGELLLQSLLRLDAISPDSEWQDARQERKMAVREVQGLLDRLDRAWRSNMSR